MRGNRSWLVAALVALVVSGCESAKPTGNATPSAASEPARAGFLFLNGAYLEPPYRVEARGTQLLVNGQVARELNRPAPTSPPAPPTAPATIASIDDLVTAGAARLAALGWPASLPTDAQVQALAAELQALRAGSSVTVEPGVIVLRDADGTERRLLYWARAPDPTADRGEALIASTATHWSQVLGSGGVLIAAGLASLVVTQGEAAAFTSDLVGALDGTRGANGLIDLLGSPGLTASLAGKAVPQSLRQRTAATSRGGAPIAPRARRAQSPGEAVTVSYHPPAGRRTPRRAGPSATTSRGRPRRTTPT